MNILVLRVFKPPAFSRAFRAQAASRKAVHEAVRYGPDAPLSRRRTLWVCGLIGALYAAAPGLAQSPEAFELEAIQTFPVPPGYDVDGATLLTDGALVGWGATGVFMLSETGARQPLEGGPAFEPRGLRVLDGHVLSFEVVGAHGELAGVGADVSPARLPVPREGFEILQSTSVPDGWS